MKELVEAIEKAMKAPESYAIRMRYRDRKGNLTERTISPTHWVNDLTVSAICLCRQEPRSFSLAAIESYELIDASDVFAPVDIVEGVHVGR